MTTLAITQTAVVPQRPSFFKSLIAVAKRALRNITRDVEGTIPAIVISVFFFVVNIGALQDFAEQIPGLDYKAFQLPVAIIFSVTGISRASTLVMDIQNGYFDRLLMTPINRLALLLGLMVADIALVIALCLPVLVLGFILGVRFETGFLGVFVFILVAASWGLAFTGFPYAIALKTGSPAAVNSSFLLFFPFVFLTTISVPKEAMTSWLAAVATYNPVTYVLEGLRAIITDGWAWMKIGRAILCVAGVGSLSMTLAFLALRSRVARS